MYGNMPQLGAEEVAARLKKGLLPRELAGPAWLRRLPMSLLTIGVAAVQRRAARSEQIECTLRPLSAVLPELGVTRVDLLKVDVEMAELDVLQGITAEHWALIHLCIVEVHDVDGRLAAIRTLLEGQGLSAQSASQEAAFVGGDVYTLIAARPAGL